MKTKTKIMTEKYQFLRKIFARCWHLRQCIQLILFCISVSSLFTFHLKQISIFLSNYRIRRNQFTHPPWLAVCFPSIVNSLNCWVLTIPVSIFGVVKISSYRSRLGCAVVSWKSCHAPMWAIYLENVHRIR